MPKGFSALLVAGFVLFMGWLYVATMSSNPLYKPSPASAEASR